MSSPARARGAPGGTPLPESAPAPAAVPSAFLAVAGNALSQAARPAVLLLAGLAYGPSVVGHLAAAFGLVVFATVALFPAMGHAVLRHREGFGLTTGLVGRMAVIVLGSTALFVALLGVDRYTVRLTGDLLPSSGWIAWVIVLAPLTVAEQYALGLCSVGGSLDRYSVAMLVSRLALFAGALVVAVLGLPSVLLFAVFAVASLLLLVQVARIVGRPTPGPAPRGLRRDGLAAAPNAWAWFLIAQASVLLVQYFIGPREAGLFTVAYLLLNLPVLALQGISMAWTSRAARQGPQAEWRRTRRVVPRLVIAHLAIVLAVAAIGIQFWDRFFGPELAPAFPLLARMAIGAPGFALAYLYLPQWVSRGWFIRLSGLYMAVALAYLAATVAAARAGDLELVAWCTAAVGVALAITNLWAGRHWDRAGPAPAVQP